MACVPQTPTKGGASALNGEVGAITANPSLCRVFRAFCPIVSSHIHRFWSDWIHFSSTTVEAATKTLACTTMEDSCFPLLALPVDVLHLVILELPSGSDVKALSRTCNVLRTLVISDVPAAWLWRRHGDRALHKAQAHEDVAMLRQLLEVHHADVNYVCVETVLFSACANRHLKVIQFLLSVPDLQVNKRRLSGLTALQHASYAGCEAVVLELLKHPSIDVNQLGGLGFAALHYAAYHNRIEAARALLGHPGIDVRIKIGRDCLCAGDAGLTALAIAERKGFKEMVALLAAHAQATSRMPDDEPTMQVYCVESCVGLHAAQQLYERKSVECL